MPPLGHITQGKSIVLWYIKFKIEERVLLFDLMKSCDTAALLLLVHTKKKKKNPGDDLTLFLKDEIMKLPPWQKKTS